MNNCVKRYFYFVVGVIINSFGIALITKAAMGTSPISSLPYVLSLRFTPTLGQFTFVMNMVFILLQVILLKKEFKPIQFLQIVVNIVFSMCIDISMSLLGFLDSQGIAAEIICLIAGCTILAFGISVEVAPDVIVVPGEGLVRAISHTVKKRFGTVKVMFDLSLVAIAVVLSLVFFGRLNGLGLGTIVSALIVGKIVNFFNKNSRFISGIAALRA